MNIIPRPRDLTVNEGALEFTDSITVAAAEAGELRRLSKMLTHFLKKDTGLGAEAVTSGAVRAGTINLVLEQRGGAGNESYSLLPR